MNSPNTWDRPDLDYRQPIPQQSEVLGTCDFLLQPHVEGSHQPRCTNFQPTAAPEKREDGKVSKVRDAYNAALTQTTYVERFKAFRDFAEIADDLVAKDWHKFNVAAPGEYGGIMHDTRGACHYSQEWSEKAAKFEAVVGASSKHVYLPEELTRQFQKWDAMFVESGRLTVELFERVYPAPPEASK
jgi:hypothetical protein